MKSQPTRALIALAAVGILAGCGGGSDDGAATAEAGDRTVEIEDFAFVPEAVEVSAGTTVTWVNRDGAAHTVADQSDLGFDESADLAEGDDFSVTYEEAGTYDYLCGIHNYMTGTVVVSS